MAQKRGFKISLTRQYDKILAILVLAGLLISLFVLARFGANSQKQKQDLRFAVETLRPTVPKAKPLNNMPYDQALYDLDHPVTATTVATNGSGVFVPACRVWCVDCRYPIPYDAAECPFCHAKQPTVAGSGERMTPDGLPEAWLMKYFGHVKPMAEDHSRANDDACTNGFSNMEKYLAGCNPLDPLDHPPYATRMKLKDVHAKLFPFVFKSHSKMPNGKQKCMFNLKAEDRTCMVEEGQQIGNTGLILDSFELKIERRPNPKLGNMMSDVDLSLIHLKRAETQQMFALQLDDTQSPMEQEVVLLLTLLGKTTECHVSAGGILDVKGERYKVTVIDVDGHPQSAILENEKTKEKYTVPQAVSQ